MEKRLFYRGEDRHHIQPYEPMRFEEDALPGRTDEGPAETRDAKEEFREEDIRELVSKMESQGYEKGYGEGRAKGVADGEKEIRGKMEGLARIIGELERFKEKKANELLPDIVALSLEIAAKVVHKEIELDKNIVLFVAKDAVKKVGEKEENITIKVNPIDYEMMISHVGVLKEQSGLKGISIEPLATISPGGCYIETQTGEIDARIEEQIREIHDAIGTTTDREM
ncbi:MAG TPA: FliH/SctL family protein [Dissulfurispiraceae bacterium]